MKRDRPSPVDEMCKALIEANDRVRKFQGELARFRAVADRIKADMDAFKEIEKNIESFNNAQKKYAEFRDRLFASQRQLLASQRQMESILRAEEARMRLSREWARALEDLRRRQGAFLRYITGPKSPRERAFGTHIREAVEIIKDWSSENQRSKKTTS